MNFIYFYFILCYSISICIFVIQYNTYIIMAKEQYSIRLSPEVIKRLKEESKKRQRSVANLIELMVREKFDMI